MGAGPSAWLWAAQANALVVRGEVVEREVVDLPGEGSGACSCSPWSWWTASAWTVGTTHLAARPGRRRREQLETALHALVVTRPGPWVLVGDLNLRAERRGTGRRPSAGSTCSTGRSRIDAPHTPEPPARPRAASRGRRSPTAASPKLPVSDHLAVWADLVAT